MKLQACTFVRCDDGGSPNTNLKPYGMRLNAEGLAVEPGFACVDAFGEGGVSYILDKNGDKVSEGNIYTYYFMQLYAGCMAELKEQ